MRPNVSYGGSSLIPAPTINISKNLQVAGGGEKLGTSYTLTINGTIVSYMGSPNSNGTFHTNTSTYPSDETISTEARLAAISRKQEAIRELFSINGKKFAWQSANGGDEVYCYPRVVSIEFSSDIWIDTCQFTIQLEADILYGATGLEDERFDLSISSASESWDINPDQVINTFAIRHNLNAVGKPIFHSDGSIITGAWEMARSYVQSRIGYDQNIVSGSLLKSTYDFANDFYPHNYVRTESIDELGGSFNLTEEWILASGHYTESYTATIDYDTQKDNSTKSVSIAGTIRGFYSNLNQQHIAYQNAVSGWSYVQPLLPARASGFFSPINFLNGSVAHDYENGTINYNYTYDNSNVISGATDEYSISSSHDATDYLTSVSIDGVIRGTIGIEDSLSVRYDKALTYWNEIQSTIYDRAAEYITGVVLKPLPIRNNIVHNPINGSITYAFEWNNREANDYLEDFSASYSFSADQGFATITANGNIRGLHTASSGNPINRYNNAIAAFPSDTTIYQRAQQYTGETFSSNIISKEITRQPYEGAISYSYSYSTQPTGCLPNIISQTLVVNDQHASDVIAQFIIPGRTIGSYLQNINTKTARVRQINFEGVFKQASTACDPATLFALKPDVNSYLSGLVPAGTIIFSTENTDSYDLFKNRLSKNITYIWEP